MAQMAQVVLDNELQIDVAGRSFPDVPGSARIGMPDDMRKMPVVGQPQLHQIAPLAGGVVLGTHPLFLPVARKHQHLFVLQPHEALMIVGRRIDQVAEDLFAGPLAIRTLVCRLPGDGE